jgi:Ca2+-binding RTX toxin-like protein
MLTVRLRIALPALAATAAAALAAHAPALANTSHAGWPQITGMLLMNKLDQSRPLDGRPGFDPFDGADPRYSCDGQHLNTACLPAGPPFAPADLPCGRHARAVNGWPQFLVRRLCSGARTAVVPSDIGHNELLGGHGDDTIHAGPAGDVLWGDYKPSGQPTSQVDRMYGGPGKDFIYASHGRNEIWTGGGDDVIHAHFGRGTIHCQGGNPIVYLSRRGRRGYHLDGCRRISYFTVGY